VRDFEPVGALDGSEDGLKFYRILAKECPQYLKEGGRVLFEIGCEQGQDVSELLRGQGFSEIEVGKDLAGFDRIVSAVWN
jgi:release factor glutamine methyltransferase